MSDRLGLRLSAKLLSRVTAVGESSSAARALMIIGLHAAGLPIDDYMSEIEAAIPHVQDPRIKAKLIGLLNTGSTPVQHDRPALRLVERTDPDHAPDLWAIGVEV